MSLIGTVLWPGLHALEPKSKLGGILARKRGYHDTRKHHLQVGRTNDYSIRMTLDKKGPDDEAAAIDWTFPDAQAGTFTTIKKYSARLLAAGRAGDPRTYGLREFFGNADLDREVEGWDFARDEVSTSDSSHLWHIHMSVHRAYVNDRKAIDAILSILKGEALAVWQKRWGITPTSPAPTKPAPKPGDTYTVRKGDTLSGIAKTYRTTVATLNAFIDHIHRLIEQLTTEPIDLVGCGFGGYLAASIAAKDPQLVASLVLESPLLPPRSGPPVSSRMAPGMAINGAMTTLRRGRIKQNMAGFARARAVLDQLAHAHPRWWESLSQITAPTLVIGGATDAGDRALLDLLAAAIPDAARADLAGAKRGHASDPQAFAAVLMPFLTR